MYIYIYVSNCSLCRAVLQVSIKSLLQVMCRSLFVCLFSEVLFVTLEKGHRPPKSDEVSFVDLWKKKKETFKRGPQRTCKRDLPLVSFQRFRKLCCLRSALCHTHADALSLSLSLSLSVDVCSLSHTRRRFISFSLSLSP